MFRKSEKNYLELNVRVSYDERTDSISITSKDKSLPKNNGGFHLSLNGNRGTEQTLRTMLEDAGIIPEEKIIPTELPYDEIADSPWDEFPLGKAGGSNTVIWNPTTSPNLFISGPAGSGKSVIERNLIFHCLQHPDKWRILGVDFYRVELSPYEKHSPAVLGIAKEIDEAVESCRFANEKMMERYEKMEELGVTNYQDLPETPYGIIFIVDEVSHLLRWSGVKNQSGVTEDALRSEAAILLTNIARLGRAAGIYLILTSQRPDASIFHGKLKDNMTTRIVMGRVDAIHSRIALGNEEAIRTPWRIRGRGYIQEYGQGKQFQAAWADVNWYDERLKNNESNQNHLE